MGYDKLEATQLGRSSHLRFGPTLVTALLLGLALGVAVPLGSVSAGVLASPPPAMTGSDSVILVGDKHGGKNWNNKNVVVVRPYRHWNKQPYYGTVIGGVALGTLLGAAAYSAVAPAPNLCWYWADPSMTRGYWDYC